MNENINLTKILKDCPSGTKFYTPVWGEVSFRKLSEDRLYAISIDTCSGNIHLTKEGYYLSINDAECIIFPSKEQRDWSKFNLKKERFDPKTLNPFDKILVRRGNENYDAWFPDFVSSPPDDTINKTLCMCIMENILMVIPYNNDTKHLVGTSDKAPEFYRYWED